MKFKNHVAFRFLMDKEFSMDIVKTVYPREYTIALNNGPISDKMHSLYLLVGPEKQQAFYITHTVMNQLNLLKVKKMQTEGQPDHYNWTVFKNLKDQKRTFILPDNKLLRMQVEGNLLCFCYLTHTKGNRDPKYDGTAYWVLFYVDRMTGKQCDHFAHQDVQEIEEFVYKLLCFIYLIENDEVVIQPGKRHGTKKDSKIINDFNIPVTIVTSRWNTTVIRTEGFPVKGHFKLYWCGPGRERAELKFLQPFEKYGYIRKAGSTIEQEEV